MYIPIWPKCIQRRTNTLFLLVYIYIYIYIWPINNMTLYVVSIQPNHNVTLYVSIQPSHNSTLYVGYKVNWHAILLVWLLKKKYSQENDIILSDIVDHQSAWVSNKSLSVCINLHVHIVHKPWQQSICHTLIIAPSLYFTCEFMISQHNHVQSQ